MPGVSFSLTFSVSGRVFKLGSAAFEAVVEHAALLKRVTAGSGEFTAGFRPLIFCDNRVTRCAAYYLRSDVALLHYFYRE